MGKIGIYHKKGRTPWRGEAIEAGNGALLVEVVGDVALAVEDASTPSLPPKPET